MTDRDRLIELMKWFAIECHKPNCKRNEKDCRIHAFEQFADYLLANGVIVPPCRCKDCTYLRESDVTNKMFCTYHGDYHEVETFPNDYCSNGVGLVKGV